MKQQIEETVSILKEAHAKISTTMVDHNLSPLRGKLLSNLQQQINTLAMQVGADPIQTTAGTVQPLKKIFGKDVEHVKKADTPVADVDHLPEERILPNIKTSKELAGAELKATVEELYPKFLQIETDAIVDTYSDMEIRGVAKVSGLPVTETTPKNADAKFVEQIKAAIKQKNELILKGQDLTGGTIVTAGAGANNTVGNTTEVKDIKIKATAKT